MLELGPGSATDSELMEGISSAANPREGVKLYKGGR